MNKQKDAVQEAVEALDRIISNADMIINRSNLYPHCAAERIKADTLQIRAALQSKPVEAIEGFNKYDRRECFADSSDRLMAYVAYSQLNEEVNDLRKNTPSQSPVTKKGIKAWAKSLIKIAKLEKYMKDAGDV